MDNIIKRHSEGMAKGTTPTELVSLASVCINHPTVSSDHNTALELIPSQPFGSFACILGRFIQTVNIS